MIPRTWSLIMVLALLASLPSLAAGGIPDTPLPTFSDGAPATFAVLIPVAVKNNGVETDVICTNLGEAAVDIGLEVFDQDGRRGNTVAAGNGAMLAVAPGQTVTIATGATAVLHEDQLIALEAPVTNLRHGSARVVATGNRVACVALAVDSLHTVDDPAIFPERKPPTIVGLAALAPCDPAECDDGDPCTADRCDEVSGCVREAAPDQMACDDGDPCTDADGCTSGVCAGTPVPCGASPCAQVSTCEASTGQCVGGDPSSACVPGGGKRRTDCAAEWVVDNPHNPKGVNSTTQVCRQGNAECDFDIDSSQCTFRVRVCLDNNDVVLLPSCHPGQVSAYELRKPTPRARKPGERVNAEAILGALEALGPAARSGKRASRLTFSPPLAMADQCTAAFSLRVAAGRTLRLRGLAQSTVGTRDTDKLKLRCERGAPRRGSRREAG